MANNVSKLPDTSVTLDLDLEERPPEDIVEQYRVKVNGRVIDFADPELMDWRDLAELDNPTELLRVALSREDAKFLRDQKLPMWKFNRLMSTYSEHYKLDERVREAKRQAQFGL